MENHPSNLLDFNNNELNNNGASSNKGSSSNSSDSCSNGTSSIFSELLKCHKPINVTLETAEEQDVLDDPLAKFKTVSGEATVISEIPSATDIEEAFIVTPGEGRKPRTFLGDEFCEELAHSHLFLTGKLGIRLKGN